MLYCDLGAAFMMAKTFLHPDKILIGAAEIASFAECSTADLMSWVIEYGDCPLRRVDNIWTVSRRELNQWLKAVHPARTDPAPPKQRSILNPGPISWSRVQLKLTSSDRFRATEVAPL